MKSGGQEPQQIKPKSYKPISNPSINQITVSLQFAFSAGSRSDKAKRHGSSYALQLRGLIIKTKISLAMRCLLYITVILHQSEGKD